MPELDKILRAALERGASDVHLLVGMPPMIRLFGDIKKMTNYDKVEEDVARKMLDEIMDDDQRNEFAVHREVDFCYEIQGVSRYRMFISKNEELLPLFGLYRHRSRAPKRLAFRMPSED